MSFESLIKCISPTLRKITYKLNGHFTFFDDNDLFQEALTHLWVAYGEGRLADKTTSYILQGCYFHLRNYIRKVEDRGACLLSLSSFIDEDGPTLEDTLSISKRPASTIDSVHAKLLIDTLMNNGLTKREKQVLSLCFNELTTRQIGKELGISHVMVVKLKKKLRSKLTALEETA